jgi:hypothetical protein
MVARVEYLDETKTYGEIIFDPPTKDDVLDEYERLRNDIGLRVPKLEKRLAERRALGGTALGHSQAENGED